jgi:small subunit ribosomal protein S27Ae
MSQEPEEPAIEEGDQQEKAPEEPEKPETQESKPEEPRPARKRKEKGVFHYYKVGDKLTRLRPFCERCGPGYFMADHRDRFTCGNCGFTRYKQSNSET